MFEFIKQIIKWFKNSDVYTINYMIFVVGGVWTLKKKYVEHSKHLIRFYYIMKVVLLLLNILVLTAMVYDGILAIKDWRRLTYTIGPTAFYIGSLHRVVVLVPQKDELEECLDNLSHNFYLDHVGKSKMDLKILKSGEIQLIKVSKIFYTFLALGLLIRASCHLASVERMLLIPFPFFEPLEWPFFEILFVCQTLALIHYMTALIASEMVVYGFIIRILKHYEIMEKNLSRIAELYTETECKNIYYSDLIISSENVDELLKFSKELSEINLLEFSHRKGLTQEAFKKCIIHHQNILRLTRKFNGIYDATFCVQIFGCGIFFAIMFTDMIWKFNELSLMAVAQSIFAGGMVLNISILCYFGSRVEDKRCDVGNALYNMPWLEMDLDNKKIIPFFLSNLLKHPRLRAGSFLPINLNTYLKCVSMTYNCVAFMQSLRSADTDIY